MAISPSEYWELKQREREEEPSKVSGMNFLNSDFQTSKKHFADKGYEEDEFSGIDDVTGDYGMKSLYSDKFEATANALQDIGDQAYYEDKLYAAGKKREEIEALQRAQEKKSSGGIFGKLLGGAKIVAGLSTGNPLAVVDGARTFL